MKRRTFISFLGGAAAAWPLAARAQQPKMLRVGYSGIMQRDAPHYAAFEKRMAELGYQQGRNFAQIEGKAYIFNGRCGPLGYEVHGEGLDAGKLVMLTGLAPKVSAQCAVVGRIPDTLRFEQLP